MIIHLTLKVEGHKWRNVVSSNRLGSEKVHPSQKESSGSENGEECLEDQVSWSEDNQSRVNQSNQQYH